MRFASIDIGTNTILMLIADVDSDGSLSVVRDEHVIARLGRGVDAHGIIQQDTFSRVRDILGELKNIADDENVQNIVACGTSALRDAVNRQAFIDFIKEHLSIDIRIVTGLEEAELTYLGAISEYSPLFSHMDYGVLDIGGGSTELVLGRGTNITSAISIDIGSVRITERILKKSPPDNSALENAVKFIHDQLQHMPSFSSPIKLVGVAGTLTTTAALNLRLPKYERSLINGHILSTDAIYNISQELSPLTLDQIRSYPQIHPMRADILLAGILILQEILKRLNLTQITVSDRGLRYGLLIKNVHSMRFN